MFNDWLSDGLSDLRHKILHVDHLVNKPARELHARVSIRVLAEEVNWSVGRFPDLEESVLTMDSFLFALGTEVVVRALRALVADTGDGRCFTAIADDA